MKVGKLDGLSGDNAVGIGELGARVAEGGLERGNRRSERGERRFGGFNGGELVEQIVVARKDLVAELGVEEAEALLEFLDPGGGGAGGEGGGGELGGVEVRREKGGEDWVGGEGV